MFDIQEMLQREITFYELFTNKISTDYGILYYNPLNPLSYDSNHAHILDIKCDFERTIYDIVGFYKRYGITPRIYPSFIADELDKLRPVLETQGFTINVVNSIFMLFQPERAKLSTLGANVRIIKKISKNVLDLAYSGNDRDWGEWGIKVWQEAIKNPNFHLLGLFSSGKCMSLASLHLMDGYSRIDDVKTHADFRDQYFGTQLMSYLTSYHTRLSENYLYLWSDNPIAIRMYNNTGFQEIKVDVPRWTAFIAPAPPVSS